MAVLGVKSRTMAVVGSRGRMVAVIWGDVSWGVGVPC